MTRLRAATSVLLSYRGAGLPTQVYVVGRLVVAPLTAMAEQLEGVRGRLLSVGSGVGVVERYLAEVLREIEVDGIDIDSVRVEAARRTEPHAPRVHLREGDLVCLPPTPQYDAVLACDVLHHIPAEVHERAATAMFECLRPGGVCVVKDIGLFPRWKYRWNRFHDRVVMGPEPIHCRAPKDMAGLFERSGFCAEHVAPIDSGTPYPHYIIRLRRPG